MKGYLAIAQKIYSTELLKTFDIIWLKVWCHEQVYAHYKILFDFYSVFSMLLTSTIVKWYPFIMKNICKINKIFLIKKILPQWRKKMTKPRIKKISNWLNMSELSGKDLPNRAIVYLYKCQLPKCNKQRLIW